ncbi:MULTISPECIES: hypothetical protein [unclassified Streptomyces]|uniref:hypothetical protein n=1 Tax=unclassified Streptomyces TaxID=2593676 RepID=UPI001BE75944|nr:MULTISPECIES: hypothetical protein [unclassified Streptomyces]MBT2376243.1 hypothetical protein [Streptomyces sp. ISL-111]MBT2429769.1 hypothetical protein [Streptomyces sp. ISL-112]MBT2464261.1 hypothetical protein [Streptomyces sp. ISL-63]
MTMTRRLHAGRRAATAALGLSLLLALSGCGDDTEGEASIPEGWSTLDTDSLSVGYPKGQGYAEQPAAERSRSNAAVALRVEDGIRTGMVSVQLNFATGVSDAAEAAAAAGAGIGLGSTRKATEDVRLAGPSSARDARRIDYDFTADGQNDTPNRGTPMTGVLVAGVDSGGVPFVVRLTAVKGAVDGGDLDAFVGSVTVK